MEKKLHILFLSSWYPTDEIPFLGNFVKRHAELIAQKHEVTVLHLQAVKKLTIFHEKSTGNLREMFVQYRSARNPIIKFLRAKNAFKAALKSVKNIDVIHGNVILTQGLQFVWAKKLLNKPLIVSEHASYYRNESSTNWTIQDKYILKNVLKEAGFLTAVSPFLESEILAVFPNLKIHILPNVIDPLIFKFKPKIEKKITNFLHVSTLDEKHKNVQGILEACQLLKAEIGTVFNLHIVSDESFSKLQKQVDQMNLNDCVRFGGPMQPHEVAKEMQEADALILFSNYETFSIVLAEAWSTGTPVISTPVGIAKDLQPSTGIQVEIGNVEAMKNAMKTVVNKKVNFSPENMTAVAEKYFPQTVLAQIESIYNDALK